MFNLQQTDEHIYFIHKVQLHHTKRITKKILHCLPFSDDASEFELFHLKPHAQGTQKKPE